MQLSTLQRDDGAVAPVIGIILVVAITVILAAVIAAFVLGLSGSDDVAPQVSFDYEITDGDTDGEVDLIITVQSGDSFDSDRVFFEGVGLGDDNAWTDVAGESESVTVRSGASVTLDTLDDDFELTIVWESADGDDSSIIDSESGPEA